MRHELALSTLSRLSTHQNINVRFVLFADLRVGAAKDRFSRYWPHFEWRSSNPMPSIKFSRTWVCKHTRRHAPRRATTPSKKPICSHRPQCSTHRFTETARPGAGCGRRAKKVKILRARVTEFVHETRSDGTIRKIDGGWSASSLCWARWVQEKRAFVFPILSAIAKTLRSR